MNRSRTIASIFGVGLLSAAISLTLTGCQGVTGSTSNPPPSSSLSVNNSSLDFGSVTLNKTKKLTFTATNSGNSSVTVSQLTITGTAFTLSGASTPLTLPAGQSATVTITFAPTSAGSDTGTVTVTSDASDPTVSISLSGTGTTAVGQLSASPSTLTIGPVVVGTSGSGSGSIKASTASVTITAASTNNSEFTIGGLSLPVTLSSGQSVPYTITFSPNATGSASATLTFTSDAQPTTATEALTGSATAAPTHNVALSWNASTSSNISGYNVYRAAYATSSCGSFAKINPTLNTTTLYTDSSVADGGAYCYATTAVNTSNQESGYSNIVSNIQIPAP